MGSWDSTTTVVSLHIIFNSSWDSCEFVHSVRNVTGYSQLRIMTAMTFYYHSSVGLPPSLGSELVLVLNCEEQDEAHRWVIVWRSAKKVYPGMVTRGCIIVDMNR
eukprot:scaffold6331_cov152-Amphora_coffeaeformis.AAC.9